MRVHVAELGRNRNRPVANIHIAAVRRISEVADEPVFGGDRKAGHVVDRERRTDNALRRERTLGVVVQVDAIRGPVDIDLAIVDVDALVANASADIRVDPPGADIEVKQGIHEAAKGLQIGAAIHPNAVDRLRPEAARLCQSRL